MMTMSNKEDCVALCLLFLGICFMLVHSVGRLLGATS